MTGFDFLLDEAVARHAARKKAGLEHNARFLNGFFDDIGVFGRSGERLFDEQVLFRFGCR